jgi:uncharacterized protein DUF3303
MSLYMVIESFKNGDPAPIYERFAERGRMMPEGLRYVSSWIDERLHRCYQLMETDDPKLFDAWIANWGDIVEFEVCRVVGSDEAARRVAALRAERGDG